MGRYSHRQLLLVLGQSQHHGGATQEVSIVSRFNRHGRFRAPSILAETDGHMLFSDIDQKDIFVFL